MKKAYGKYAAMIVTSSVLMYVIMYLNTYEMSHVYFSEMRLYMTILSAAVMAVVMLLFMMNMLKNKRVNAAIIALSIVVFAGSFYLMRNQTTIDDVDWMEGMIPHHSIAILTSKRAPITDERVRKLADDIIEAQEREIAEMKELIHDIKNAKK